MNTWGRLLKQTNKQTTATTITTTKKQTRLVQGLGESSGVEIVSQDNSIKVIN